MTSESLWKAVGKELALCRETKGWTWADVERAGGPAAPTVRDNERGRARTIVALRKHTEALGISLVDVLTMVIDRRAGRPTVSPALAAIVRKYEQTTPQGRIAIRAVSDICPEKRTEARRGARRGAAIANVPVNDVR